MRLAPRKLHHDARCFRFARVPYDPFDESRADAALAARLFDVKVAQKPDSPTVPRRPQRIELNEAFGFAIRPGDEYHGVIGGEALRQELLRSRDIGMAREEPAIGIEEGRERRQVVLRGARDRRVRCRHLPSAADGYADWFREAGDRLARGPACGILPDHYIGRAPDVGRDDPVALE